MRSFPLEDMVVVGMTIDSMSFQKIDTSIEVEIPLGNHVGAFGVRRRFDVHKGIDLYAPEGKHVVSIEEGRVVDLRWFTGARADSPWWRETQAVSVLGKTGIYVYGEILIDSTLSVGDVIVSGQRLGAVERVLKKDKGRPTSMLHLALHHPDVMSNGVWRIGGPQPPGLIDPTNRLISLCFKDGLTESLDEIAPVQS